jgi:translation initiation factor IF-2
MAEGNKLRLNKVLRELNISLDRAVEHLAKNGHEIEARPTTKISDKEYQILFDGFQTDKSKKIASKEVSEEKRKEKETNRQRVEEEQEKKRLEDEAKKQEVLKAKAKKLAFKTVGKIDVKTGKAVEEKKEPAKEPIKEEVKVVVEAPKKRRTCTCSRNQES